jgi:hypothetical protein
MLIVYAQNVCGQQSQTCKMQMSQPNRILRLQQKSRWKSLSKVKIIIATAIVLSLQRGITSVGGTVVTAAVGTVRFNDQWRQRR